MIKVKQQTATCDWPHCHEFTMLHAENNREAVEQLRRMGWRASAILDDRCICPRHKNGQS